MDTGTNAFASGVVAAGKTVFVSGVVLSDWLVRAHDIETGQLLWEDRFDRLGLIDSPRPGAIAVSGGLLFVVGAADALSAFGWSARTDAATGTLVWQDQLRSGLGSHGAESLVVQRGRVFAGGFGTAPNSRLSDRQSLRGLDRRTTLGAPRRARLRISQRCVG